MSTTNNEEKIISLQSNQSFLENIAKAADASEFKKVFSNYGVEITEEEAAEIVKNLAEVADVEVTDSELNEEELDNVNGGFASVVIFGYAVPKLLIYTFTALVAVCGASAAYKKLKKQFGF